MSICEQCPLRDGCIERRGICRDYILYMERVEKVREQIEKLNETKETPAEGAISANESGREPSLLCQPCGDSDILREEFVRQRGAHRASGDGAEQTQLTRLPDGTEGKALCDYPSDGKRGRELCRDGGRDGLYA